MGASRLQYLLNVKKVGHAVGTLAYIGKFDQSLGSSTCNSLILLVIVSQSTFLTVMLQIICY